MNIMPMVSVIIPVYNGEKFIARAIESVLAQTLPAYEIIVIDDGSTDKTADVLKQFQGKIVWKTISNQGVSMARNIGIELSGGEWVAFLDADDVWYPDKLEKQVMVLKNYPEVEFCCGNYDFIDTQNGQKTDLFTKYRKGGRGLAYNIPLKHALPVLLCYNFIGTPGVVVKKSILGEIGKFNVNYRQSEDYDLWLRCALKATFFVSSEPLFFCSRHNKNLTNDWLETCQHHKQVLIDFAKKNMDILRKERLNSWVALNLARKHYEIGNLLYEKKDFRHAFSYYVRGLKCSYIPINIARFFWITAKKIMRTVSGGLCSRRTIKLFTEKYR